MELQTQTLCDNPGTYLLLRGLLFFRAKPGWTKTSTSQHNTDQLSSHSPQLLSSHELHGVKTLQFSKSQASTSFAAWCPDSSTAQFLAAKGQVSEQTVAAIAVIAIYASLTSLLLSIRVTRYEKPNLPPLLPPQCSLYYNLSRNNTKRGWRIELG